MTAPSPNRRRLHIAHLTSVHPATDTRIFHKECVSLAEAGHDVVFVVPGATDGVVKSVRLRGVPVATNRFGRGLLGTWRVGRAAWAEKADVYHFHDPELLILGLVLRVLGRKVVYDAHEWVRGDVASKPYLKPWLAKTLSVVVASIEWVAGRTLTHVVTATPFIASQFPPDRVTVIGNYPDLRELDTMGDQPPAHHADRGVYIGGLNDERCGREILEAVALANDQTPAFRLLMAGPIDDGLQPASVPAIEHVGMLGRQDVMRLTAEASFGLVLLRALPNCIDALPTKFFEYLAAGVPAIVSRSTVNIAAIVDEVQCGLVVDEEDPRSIADALVWMVSHHDEAMAMGTRGAAAVNARYNWSTESAKLVALYDRIATT